MQNVHYLVLCIGSLSCDSLLNNARYAYYRCICQLISKRCNDFRPVVGRPEFHTHVNRMDVNCKRTYVVVSARQHVSDLDSFAFSTGVCGMCSRNPCDLFCLHTLQHKLFLRISGVSAYFTNTEKVRITNWFQAQECAKNVALELFLRNRDCSGSVLTIWAWLENWSFISGMGRFLIFYTEPGPCSGIAQSVWRLATGWAVRGSNLGGGRAFPHPSRTAVGPPNFLFNRYRVSFHGVKQPERGVDQPPLCRTEVKERVELYLTPPQGLHYLF